MNKPQFNIGDEVFIAQRRGTERKIVCPDCFGSGELKCILGDGSEVRVDCPCCESGYYGSLGYVTHMAYSYLPIKTVVSAVETEGESFRYATPETFRTEWIGLSFDDALTECVRLSKEETEESKRRALCKEKDTKSWAWHVLYHRREIRELEKRIAYHKAKLEVSKAKVKCNEGEC